MLRYSDTVLDEWKEKGSYIFALRIDVTSPCTLNKAIVSSVTFDRALEVIILYFTP